MTKKHFVALAQVLRREMPVLEDHKYRGNGQHNSKCFETCHHSWLQMVDSLADFCASQNSQFYRERFLAACGVKG